SAAVMAISRAIENGFSLVRPTGNGTTLVTDYQGRILASQDYMTNTSGILLTSVPMHGFTTIYSHIGDLLAYLCGIGLVLLTILAFLRQAQPLQVTHPQAFL
ncbi:MAG TPA: hypothetical protein VKF38_01430, partial [Anaerolineaceae bacterium]|nr:hypothetical protein [Anaerolineaceae bacterium]